MRTLLLQHLQDQRKEGDSSKPGEGRGDQQTSESHAAAAPATVSGKERSIQNCLAQQPWPVSSLLPGNQLENRTSAQLEDYTTSSVAQHKDHTPPLTSEVTPTSITRCEDHTPASAPQRVNHTPASAPQHVNHTPASAPQRENHTPASALQRENHTPASAPQRENHTPASAPQCVNHTPASAPQHVNHTPASTPQRVNHTPASAPQRENHTPDSVHQHENHTPASAPQCENHSLTSNRQRGSCSTTDIELRTSCVHDTSCSLAHGRAMTLPAAVSHSTTHHHSSGCTTSHSSSRSNTFACPAAVHWASQDSPHQTAYNSPAPLAVPNRHRPTSCSPTVHHATTCSAVSGHRGPQTSQNSPAVHPHPLTTWASPPVQHQPQPSQQTIVQPWVSSNHSSTHLRHLPHSPPDQQRPRMTYTHRDRRTRSSQPYYTGMRPHQATSCRPQSGREYSSHLASAAYGQHPSSVETNTQAYTGYSHTAEPLPHYQPSYGYRMPSNVPPPLTAYSSPPVPSCSAPGAQRHPYPSPLPQSQGAVWRPYSDNSRSSGFCLADIISLPPPEEQLGPPPPPHNPSFLMDHLLDDI